MGEDLEVAEAADSSRRLPVATDKAVRLIPERSASAIPAFNMFRSLQPVKGKGAPASQLVPFLAMLTLPRTCLNYVTALAQ